MDSKKSRSCRKKIVFIFALFIIGTSIAFDDTNSDYNDWSYYDDFSQSDDKPVIFPAPEVAKANTEIISTLSGTIGNENEVWLQNAYSFLNMNDSYNITVI